MKKVFNVCAMAPRKIFGVVHTDEGWISLLCHPVFFIILVRSPVLFRPKGFLLTSEGQKGWRALGIKRNCKFRLAGWRIVNIKRNCKFHLAGIFWNEEKILTVEKV